MARYTSVSFPGHAPVSLKFSDTDRLYAKVMERTSAELRDLIGIESYEELHRRADSRGVSVHAFLRAELENALAGGRPYVYRGWPAGSLKSEQDARAVVRAAKARSFLDPFAGRANYAGAAASEGLRSFYCEISPVFRVIAAARLAALSMTRDARRRAAAELRAFEPAAKSLVQLQGAIVHAGRWPVPDLLRAVVAEALPRTPGELTMAKLNEALSAEIRDAAAFVEQEPLIANRPQLVCEDARDLALFDPLDVELVVTNPPSLNFRSYAQPLAAAFLGVQKTRAERSLATHAANEVLAIPQIVRNVAAVNRRDRRMGRVVANYFVDLADAFRAVSHHMSHRATIAVEIEDSTVAGVHVDTRQHTIEIVESLGFSLKTNGGRFLLFKRR
ncbi:MAG TPA: hypothetical protein VF980_07025 [Thermoanaerobaculia bacterium]